MNPEGKPSFVGIVFSGSPLFNGEAGSGESEIRRWALENDRVYALVALPEKIFYNVGIQTYLWILTNRKSDKAKGKVLLLDVSGDSFYTQLPKSIGAKQRDMEEHIPEVVESFASYKNSENSRILKTTDFGYRRIQVERPLRLNFQNSEERIALLADVKAFAKLVTSKKRDPEAKAKEEAAGKALQESILEALRAMPTELIRDAEIFEANLKRAFKGGDLKLPAPLKKAIAGALSERDEDALPVIKKVFATVNASEAAERIDERHGFYGLENNDGTIRIVEYEPDGALRDHENVPLDQDVDAYFEAEVAPYVPDAWINPTFTDHKDGLIGKVGYSINFNRYFCRYQAPRKLKLIDRDIREVEDEIISILKEVTE